MWSGAARWGCVFFNNVRYLNAEDDTTVGPLEYGGRPRAARSQDPGGSVAGNPVTHPKYRGRRVSRPGLNLTHLYQGKLPLLFFAIRDLGFVGKLYRGLTGDEYDLDAPEATLEEPCIVAVVGFAIGGGCQLLLVVDYVIAESRILLQPPGPERGHRARRGAPAAPAL